MAQPHEVEEQLKRIRENQERMILILEQMAMKLGDIVNRVGA